MIFSLRKKNEFDKKKKSAQIYAQIEIKLKKYI